QMEQISPIVDRAASQLEAKREQTMREVRNIFEETHRSITPFLTPEQQTKLDKLEQRHARRFHRHGFMPPPEPAPYTSIEIPAPRQFLFESIYRVKQIAKFVDP